LDKEMAHFARIQSGVVAEVIVVANEVLLDENGIEQESIGAAFCADLFGGEWVQTSYNAKFRGQFANPGFLWNGKEFKSVPLATGEVV
jgi:hypothetical protein